MSSDDTRAESTVRGLASSVIHHKIRMRTPLNEQSPGHTQNRIDEGQFHAVFRHRPMTGWMQAHADSGIESLLGGQSSRMRAWNHLMHVILGRPRISADGTDPIGGEDLLPNRLDDGRRQHLAGGRHPLMP
jgi:hypothetical protein